MPSVLDDDYLLLTKLLFFYETCFFLVTINNRYNTRRLVLKKNCFSAWASTLNMGLINKVDMVCLSPVGYGV